MTIDDYLWWAQLGLSLGFATLLARTAARRGRHPVGAALLLLAFANGWPVVWSAVGRGIAAGFGVSEVARATMGRVFGAGGLMFGVALSFAIVGCLRPARQPTAGVGEKRC